MYALRRVTIVSLLLALLTSTLWLAGTGAPEAQPRPLKRLNVQLGWIKNTEFAGLFVADQRGWFAQEGLDVNFISGGAGIDPINIVRANPTYIGVVASSGALITAVSRGAKLKAVAAYYQKHPNCFLMLDDSPIKTYRDFEGRRIGVQPEGEHYLQALAAVHGLSMNKIQVVRVGFDPTPLLTGQIDAYMAWIINQPYRLEKAGKRWRALLLADNPGLTFYAMLPFATDQLIKEQPDVVEGFLRASLRGWQGVLENPDEAARITVEKYLPGGDLEAEKWLLKHANPITVSDDTRKYGLGWMDLRIWETGRDTLLKYKQIERAPEVGEMVDLSFLKKIHGK
jgi:ABC-type nitrate/sulfonate/bicarbonate transport system substrate-binding protein